MGVNTYNAFLSRGLSSIQAQALVNKGYNIQKVQVLKAEDLDALQLNLTQDQKDGLLSGRPPIPDETFNELMFKSKWVCCICRNRNKGIIIHHIVEWSTSRSHDLDNLSVLCLDHHGEAHTKRELSQNLTADAIKSSRDLWYERTQREDTDVILERASVSWATWAYFNHTRLYELIPDSNNCTSFPSYCQLLELAIIERNGKMANLSEISGKDSTYMYRDGRGVALYQYHKALFISVFKTLPIKYINNYQKDEINGIVKTRDFVFYEGLHYFKRQTNKDNGIGQSRLIYSKGNSYSFNAVIDAFEATSNSCWSDHLTNMKKVVVLYHVRSIQIANNKTSYACSCLAIGFHFGGNSGFHESEDGTYTSNDFMRDVNSDLN